MAHLNNPAGRLHELLTRAKQESGQQQARLTWAKILKVEPPDDTPLLFRRLAKVYELPLQIRAPAEKYAKNPALNLKWRPKVEKALSQTNLEQPWSHVIDQIDDYTLLSLEYCDNLLDEHSVEGGIDGKKLREVAEKVAELAGQVRESDIDSEIAAYILERLAEVMEAIDEFSLTGPAGLSRAVEANLGGLVTHVNIFMERAGDEEKSFLTKFLITLNALAAVVNITVGTPKLPAAIQWALPEAPQTEQVEHVEPNTTGG